MVNMVTLENGTDVVTISNYLPQDFMRLAGMTGVGIAPTKLIMNEGALEGSVWKRTKRLARSSITLPLHIAGSNRADVLQKMRKVVRVLRDDQSTAKMFVDWPDGSRVFVPVHYSGGADPKFGTDTNGKDWVRWPLVLSSENAYWTAERSKTFTLGNAVVGRGLIKDASLTRLELSASNAIGSIKVQNNGDVASPLKWQVIGPCNSLEASSLGKGFTYDAPVPDGGQLFIDSRAATVVDETGANMYTHLGTAPKLFFVPPGSTVINISMPGTTSVSRVIFSFQERYELVF